MSNGTNWTGGRGKKAKRGLRILEYGPGQHFDSRRVVNYSLTQNQLQTASQLNHTSMIPFQHAQQQRQMDEAARPVLPNVLNKPNMPTRQSRLPGLVDAAVRNLESLDAKRAQINALDAKSLAGLNKRKYIADPDWLEHEGPVRKRSFNFPTQSKPRAFIASPSPEPFQIESLERSEDMLSFGTPSDQNSTSGTQISRTNDVQRPLTDNRHPQNSAERVESPDIPPTMYEDAARAAARALNLPDTPTPSVFGVPSPRARMSPNRWLRSSLAQPNRRQDDSQIRAFNLFMPAQVDTSERLGPEMAQQIPGHRLSPASETTAREDTPNNMVENRARQASLALDRRGLARGRRALVEIQDGPAAPTLEAHASSGTGTKTGITQTTKHTRKTRCNSGRGPCPPSPLSSYLPSKHINTQRSFDRESNSSGVLVLVGTQGQGAGESNTNVAIKSEEPSLDCAPTIRESCSTCSSQESRVSLVTGINALQTIGLQLFNDNPFVEDP